MFYTPNSLFCISWATTLYQVGVQSLCFKPQPDTIGLGYKTQYRVGVSNTGIKPQQDTLKPIGVSNIEIKPQLDTKYELV